MHVVFDETNPKLQDQVLKNAHDENILFRKQFGVVNESAKKEIQCYEKTDHNNLPKEWISPKGLLKDNIIDEINPRVSTRHKLTYCEHVTFVSQIEPKNVNDALIDSNWIIVMQDELN